MTSMLSSLLLLLSEAKAAIAAVHAVFVATLLEVANMARHRSHWANTGTTLFLTFSHKLGRAQPGAARSHSEQETLDKSNRATAKMTLDMTLGRLFCFVIYRAMPPKPKPMTMESVYIMFRPSHIWGGIGIHMNWHASFTNDVQCTVCYDMVCIVLWWYVMSCASCVCFKASELWALTAEHWESVSVLDMFLTWSVL